MKELFYFIHAVYFLIPSNNKVAFCSLGVVFVNLNQIDIFKTRDALNLGKTLLYELNT